jgi:hypothetical protein
VDALQNAALAPLDLVVVCDGSVFKTAPHKKALRFEADERLKDGLGVE